VENAGPGSRGVENARSKWKTRDLVENAGSGGKCGVYVENTGSKRKTRGNVFSRKYEFSSLK